MENCTPEKLRRTQFHFRQQRFGERFNLIELGEGIKIAVPHFARKRHVHIQPAPSGVTGTEWLTFTILSAIVFAIIITCKLGYKQQRRTPFALT